MDGLKLHEGYQRPANANHSRWFYAEFTPNFALMMLAAL